MTRDHHRKWPQFEWTADALIERHPSRTFIYGRWDRLFDCWQITNDAFGLQPFVPRWPLLDCTGALTLQGSPTPAATEEWEETLLQDKSYFSAAEWEAHFSYDVSIDETADRELDAAAQHAFQMYIELVPFHTRRLAAPFRSWQWLVLTLISDWPTFAEFLASELRSIGPGFVAGCLALSRAHTLSRSERRALCHQIMIDKRALLVGRLVGMAHTELLVRCLAKVQLDALECASWPDLIHIMGDRNKARVVSHVKVLTPTIVRLLSQLPSWICSVPLLLRLHESPEYLREEATALVMSLGTLVATQPPCVKAAIRSSLKQAEDSAHLINLLIRWRQRIADRAPFPRPPIPGTDILTPLTSVKMIQREAVRMRNCIIDYVPSVLSGTRYLYRWEDDELATVCIERSTVGEWRLRECAGVGNTRLKQSTHDQIAGVVHSLTFERPLSTDFFLARPCR